MKKKVLNVNTILIGIVLVFGVVFFAYQKMTQKSGAIATVYAGGSTAIKEIDLSKDARYDITEGVFDVHLVVKDGAIAFENSECPDHLCEGFGFIHNEDEFAICAPAGIGVIVTKGE